MWLLFDRLVDDTAWHPVLPEQAETWDPVSRFVLRTFLGSPLKLWASVGHWLIWHFNLDLYTEKQKPRVTYLSKITLLFYSCALKSMDSLEAFHFACRSALNTLCGRICHNGIRQNLASIVTMPGDNIAGHCQPCSRGSFHRTGPASYLLGHRPLWAC